MDAVNRMNESKIEKSWKILFNSRICHRLDDRAFQLNGPIEENAVRVATEREETKECAYLTTFVFF